MFKACPRPVAGGRGMSETDEVKELKLTVEKIRQENHGLQMSRSEYKTLADDLRVIVNQLAISLCNISKKV